VNRTWLNVVASIIVGALVMLSLLLAVETIFPSVDSTRLLLVLGSGYVVALLISGALQLRAGRSNGAAPPVPLDRWSWQMPALETLPKPTPSLTRTTGLVTLRGYLLIAVVVLAVKVVLLALGH
jgi:hypothetical protein